MTTTSLANCLALRTTEPIVGPSLYAGIAATILDSTRVRRRTAGTGADASLSMWLSTLHSEVEQGSLASLQAPEGGIPTIRVLPTFSKSDEKSLPFSLPVLDALDSTRDRLNARGFRRHCHRYRSTKDRTDSACIG